MKNWCCNNDKEGAKSIVKKVLMGIGFAILAAGLVILFGFVIMWLWNWLMPLIFALPTITYWQAVGLFILAKIIFGGIGGGGGDDSGSKKTPKGSIKHEIKSEIKKEFDKEFGKEFDKEWEKEFGKESEETPSEGTTDEEKSNQDYDDLYEKWWSEKGESSFKDYMNKKDDLDD